MALLLLDLMNDIVHPEGSGGHSPFAGEVASRRTLENAASLLEEARRAGLLVVFVRVGFRTGYPEVPDGVGRFARARDNSIFRLGSWGTQIHDALAPGADEPIVEKHRVSPFFATPLEPILRARNIGRLTVAGVSTNAVVQAAVREGSDRDFQMAVAEDCCAAATEAEHQAAITTLKGFAAIASGAELAGTMFGRSR